MINSSKAEAANFAEVMSKYGTALCALYPSQVKTLRTYLAFYNEYGIILKVKDPFTGLAFNMIIADLIYQEKQKGAEKDDKDL